MSAELQRRADAKYLSSGGHLPSSTEVAAADSAERSADRAEDAAESAARDTELAAALEEAAAAAADEDEPVVAMQDLAYFRKYVMFPITDHGAYELYKNHVAVFWKVEDFAFKLCDDVAQFARVLTEDEKHLILNVHAFFAASDGIVSENLVARFSMDSDLPEVRAFYAAQNFFEQIHSEAYSLIIDRLVPNPAAKSRLFRAVENHACVRRKALWGHRWITESDKGRADGPARRLAAFACVEGIFFSSSFATIYWFKSRNLLPGIASANEWISRDEGLHTDFAVYRYRSLPQAQRMSEADLYRLVDDAVQIEIEFVRNSIPRRLRGLNADNMSDYVRFVADRLLVQFGLKPAYGGRAVVPLSFMEQQSGITKSNFFECAVSNYAIADPGDVKVDYAALGGGNNDDNDDF